MTDNLTYIHDEIKRLRAIASDLEWEGDNDRAKPLWERVKALQTKLDNGELYEPKF